ncbi:LAGLIDADG family homing endonuclease [Paraliobacillus zengyii]|uniref:LAGLIDADG family homing endonuclease n=1 Tax=Paraliobacillus zengyii TaxID=2213194 RepID=UPI000DD3BF59|nr:LAGLIDADG family homing endonuclease [Paraliobacillus zengyii]
MNNCEAAYLAGIIDGEGSITLTRMHEKENRRPCISVASTDKELLEYIKSIAGGVINNKKNYNPNKHKDSYTLYIKRKHEVFYFLEKIYPFLRIEKKKNRAKFILDNYTNVTPRNGKYNQEQLSQKQLFETDFFLI